MAAIIAISDKKQPSDWVLRHAYFRQLYLELVDITNADLHKNPADSFSFKKRTWLRQELARLDTRIGISAGAKLSTNSTLP